MRIFVFVLLETGYCCCCCWCGCYGRQYILHFIAHVDLSARSLVCRSARSCPRPWIDRSVDLHRAVNRTIPPFNILQCCNPLSHRGWRVKMFSWQLLCLFAFTNPNPAHPHVYAPTHSTAPHPQSPSINWGPDDEKSFSKVARLGLMDSPTLQCLCSPSLDKHIPIQKVFHACLL